MHVSLTKVECYIMIRMVMMISTDRRAATTSGFPQSYAVDAEQRLASVRQPGNSYATIAGRIWSRFARVPACRDN